MPYGLPKEKDTPANNRKMERCVADVMKDGKSKESAIRICKDSIMKSSEPQMKQKIKASRLPIFFPIQFAEGETIPKEIHILPMGVWDHPAYGKIIINANDIREFKSNFDRKIRKDIPITEGHEVMDEKPAVGWFKELREDSNGLYATVEWTEKGKELLTKKYYKYFSPEFYREYEDPETREITRNVLVGGALTNKPYFKELEAVVLSEHKIKTNEPNNNKTMNTKDILAKAVADWTDEEKAYVREHQAELSDEEKETAKDVLADAGAGAGDGKGDGDGAGEGAGSGDGSGAGEGGEGAGAGEGEPAKASEKNAKMVQISAAELKALQTKADAGQQAFIKMREMEVSNDVATMTFSETNKEGRFLPKSAAALKKFMHSLTREQYSEFKAIVKELPKTNIFGEAGATNASENSATKQVETAVNKLMASDKAMKYSDALKQVFNENPELAERYNAELA